MTQTSSPQLESDPGFRRLLRYLTLSERFLLALVHAHIPLAAAAILEALPDALSQRRGGQFVRLISLDPYPTRADPNDPLEQDAAIERVLRPLSEGPPEDRARGVLLVIDGSRYLPQDAPAWSYLFARMNEQRNGIIQKLSCELLLLGPAVFLDLFARTAPDFWSIRSGEFCEELPLNRPPPVPLPLFLSTRASLPPLPERASPPLLEAYIEFTKLPDPSPDDFLLASLVRDPWRKLGQAIRLVHQGDLAQASSSLAQVRAELEALPSQSGFAPSISYFFALHQARLYSAHADYHSAGALAAMARLHEALEADTVGSGHFSTFCAIQTLLLRAMYQQKLGDDARASASKQGGARLFASLEAGEEEASTWRQIGDFTHDLGDDSSTIEAWQREASIYQSLDDESKAALAWGRVGDILQARGQLGEALAIRKDKELPLYQQLGDVRSEAITWGQVSDILWRQGQLDEALIILQDKQLPVFQRLSDIQSEAAAWGAIGDILRMRGQFDEALTIYKAKVLPLCQHSGDRRSEATAWTQIAIVLRLQGHFDEALAVLIDNVLSVDQQQNDLRGEVVTWGQIADIFMLKGQPTKALNILQDKVLPFYQQQGDLRGQAVAWGQIADIFKIKGQFDAALTIYKNNVLPVHQRLGDIRLEALAWGQIAEMQIREQPDEAMAVLREKVLPVEQRLGDVRSEAITWGQIADILRRRGQFDEALAIYKNKVLPIEQQLRAPRGVLVAQTNLAVVLLQRAQGDDLDQAKALLQEALKSAEELRLPEAEQIKALLDQHGWPPREG